jgi:hypothetical protein
MGESTTKKLLRLASEKYNVAGTALGAVGSVKDW